MTHPVARSRHARVVPVLTVLTVLAAAAGILASAPVFAAPAGTPQQAPTIASVQRNLGQLALRNTLLVESYDQARQAAAGKQATADRATAAASHAQASFAEAQQQMRRTIAVQYESTDLNPAYVLLTSPDRQAYINSLNAMDLLATQQARIVEQLTAVQRAAVTTAQAARRASAAASAQLMVVGRTRTQVATQISQYRDLLDSLTAAQQKAFRESINPTVQPSAVTFLRAHVTGSEAAKAAVRFALDQVGKPYSYGAAGPGSYDCSGLTMASWAKGGVSLPHSAAGQYGYGEHVSVHSLVPGDLIFMYSPIGHVTIYVGEGLMVSAPTEGEPVSVVPVAKFSGDIVGATHLG